MSTEKGSRLLQYVAASTGNLNIMACGAILGWTSPMLPRLQEHDPIAGDNQLGRAISKDEGSWLAALVPLGVTVGSIFAGYLGEWLGRKRSLLIGTLPFLVGWILVGTARHIEQMYAGRFILGLSVAIPFTFLPTYVGEISEAAVRGALGSLLQIFVSMGFIYSYVIGPYTSYTTLWLLCASLHIVFFLGFLFMPESPYYLLSKGQVDDACKTLARFRGKSVEAVQKEIEEIQSELNEAPQENSSSWKDVLLVPVNRKAVILTSILMSFQEFIGIDVVLAYVENIFRDAGTKDTALSAIVVGVVQLFASSIAPLFVDKYGRKILLVISSIGCCLTIGLLGAYFYLKKIDYPLDNMGWVPLATLVFYIITYSIGWGPMPWMIMGEMFASSVKSKASSICVFSIWGFSFLLTKIFVDIQEERGPHMGFWFFSVCAALSIIFVTMFFPETRCKTLAEIQQQLSRGVHQKEEKSKKKNSLNNRQIEVAVITPVLDTDKAQGPV